MSNRAAPIVLWDIDGTLLVTDDSGLRHYHRALSLVVPDAQLPNLSTHGKTDWQIVIELLAAAGQPTAIACDVSDQLDQLARAYLDEERLQLLPKVSEALALVSSRGARNGLLTGNSELRSRCKLVGAGLDWQLIDTEAGFFGARAPRRAELALAARERFPSQALLIVGDTPFDGLAAATAEIPFVAVCTGNYRPADFEAVPSVAIADRLDIEAIELILGELVSGATRWSPQCRFEGLA